MRQRHLAAIGVVAAVIAGVAMARGPIAGPSSLARVAEASGAAAQAWTPSRTPWGDPDLQGIWGAGYIFTPLERPDEFAGREFLTDEEVAALEQAAADTFGVGAGGIGASGSRTGRPERGTVADVEGAYNDVYSGRGTQVIRTKRTSLIVDPPDGKIPYTADAQRRSAAEAADWRALRARADGPEDRPDERCLGVSLPIRFGIATASGAYSRIVQTPGHVALYYEHGNRGGAYRTIFLDGRPHLPPHLRQWLGDARGHWDDNTLVVDTTNFTDTNNWYYGVRENLHLIERFTPVAPDVIMYRATIDDPTTFTRPWTIEVPLTKKDNRQNQIYESACHEGNYALTGILAGARALEQDGAETQTGAR